MKNDKLEAYHAKRDEMRRELSRELRARGKNSLAHGLKWLSLDSMLELAEVIREKRTS